MTDQELKLEELLRAAASDPSARPDFYRALLDATVFVIGSTGDPALGRRTLLTDEKAQLLNWTRGDGFHVIPFFTSMESLQRAISEQVSYIGLPARTLFEMTKGATLVINGRLEHGKEFFPQEIEALLAGGMNREPEQRIMQRETKVLLGQPANFPAQMVDALTAVFSKRNQVKAAYVLLMHDTSRDAKPHLVVGVQADGVVEDLFREVGVVAGDSAPKGEPVDLYRVDPNDKGLSQHFLSKVKPFYERSWGTRLRGMLQPGRA